MRRIRISYSKTTPESVEQGDLSDAGWENEDGIECDIDQEYIDEYGSEHAAIVNRAVNLIYIYGQSVEPSSSQFHSGIWYTETEGTTNYRTGESTQYSFHLSGFTEQEESDIFGILTKR